MTKKEYKSNYIKKYNIITKSSKTKHFKNYNKTQNYTIKIIKLIYCKSQLYIIFISYFYEYLIKQNYIKRNYIFYFTVIS